MKQVLTLLSALILSGGICHAATGPLIFSDDFETVGLFAENWNASKGLKPEKGFLSINGNGNIQLRRKMTDTDFAVSADLTPGKNNGEYGHTGFIIDGIHFMLYASGKAGTAYRPPTYKRSLGHAAAIPGYTFGDTCNVKVIRQYNGKSRKYVFQVNGRTLISFQDSDMVPTDTVKIYAYRAKLAVDNVAIHSVSRGSDSPNLVVNSSFEHLLDGMPTYVNLATNRNITWKTPYSEYLKTAVIDTKEKHSGNNSLRLTFNDSVSKAGFLMWSAGCSVGKPVTGSVWLKADRPQLEATLNIWELHHKTHSKKITVTDRWKRYEFTLLKPERNRVQFGAALSAPGVIWADDIQVELGEKATPYKASALDADKFNVPAAKPVSIMPDVKIAAVRKAPVIDGDLSDFPKECKVTGFLHKGSEAPRENTVAYLACDTRNLYVAFECAVPDASKINAQPFPRDMGKVYAPESIEMFFDPAFSRRQYYQFAVNAANSQADCGPGRNSGWNGDWKSAVKINPETGSIHYEIAIPLSNFADAEMTDAWGFNLGRNCRASHQLLSLLHTPQLNYHLVSIYPKLVFPPGMLNRARIGFVSPGLHEGADGKATFSATVRNLTGKAIPDGTLRLLDSKTGETLGSSAIRLPAGDTEVRFASTLPNSEKNRNITLVLSDGGETLTRKNFILSVAGPLELYSRYNFFLPGENAEFRGRCSLPPGKWTGTARIAGKEFSFPVKPELGIQIPLKDIKPGRHPVVFTISGKAGKAASATAEITILPEGKQHYCRIDRKYRTLEIGGKPALIVAPFLGVERKFTPEMSRNLVRTFAEAGFKYLTCGSHEPDNPATRAFMEEAEKHGIQVVYWNFYAWRMRDKWNPEEFAAKVRRYPNLIAVLIVDEPELYAKSDEVRAFMRKYQAVLPEFPVFMNNTVIGIPARFADLATDIVMIDDYLTNSETRTLQEMLNGAEMVEKAGRSERKPAWFFPSGDNLHNHYRECSFAEQLAQCYGMLIRGCTGLVHFAGLPKYPRNWEALQQVNREFQELQDIVFSAENCPDAVSSDKSLAVMTRKSGNTLCVIALNPGTKPLSATFRLPAEYKYAGKADVRFEKRSIALDNGMIHDVFQPMERHVYMIRTAE